MRYINLLLTLTLPFNVVQSATDNFCVLFLAWPNVVTLVDRELWWRSFPPESVDESTGDEMSVCRLLCTVLSRNFMKHKKLEQNLFLKNVSVLVSKVSVTSRIENLTSRSRRIVGRSQSHFGLKTECLISISYLRCRLYPCHFVTSQDSCIGQFVSGEQTQFHALRACPVACSQRRSQKFYLGGGVNFNGHRVAQ